jgi:hypothetical protein
MWSENARARVRGAGHKGGKLRLLAVPHIFRRQGGVSIISLTHRSGGPSGSACASRYRSPHSSRDHTRSRLSGQWSRDHVDDRTLTTHATLTGARPACRIGPIAWHASPPRWWAIVPTLPKWQSVGYRTAKMAALTQHILSGPTLPT